jgi:hypothetical protein
MGIDEEAPALRLGVNHPSKHTANWKHLFCTILSDNLHINCNILKPQIIDSSTERKLAIIEMNSRGKESFDGTRKTVVLQNRSYKKLDTRTFHALGFTITDEKGSLLNYADDIEDDNTRIKKTLHEKTFHITLHFRPVDESSRMS